MDDDQDWRERGRVLEYAIAAGLVAMAPVAGLIGLIRWWLAD